jgi:hypothetical protein
VVPEKSGSPFGTNEANGGVWFLGRRSGKRGLLHHDDHHKIDRRLITLMLMPMRA